MHESGVLYVGRYEVRNEIATGGFAVVLKAWDEELESFVALKVLHRKLADDEDVQLRFLEEARLLRRIRSPNVVTVHDVGRLNDGRPYFVMDFADRGTLALRLKGVSGAHPPDHQSIIALVDAVADGLSAIHEAGVVHRDIKPENILLQRARRVPAGPDDAAAKDETRQSALVHVDERILVGDLGIAKDLLKHASTTTLVGGTPLYQSPEQDDPTAEITPAADVYAATAMLWHVLTGEKPPEATGVAARLNNLPDLWRNFIAQGMAIDPDARFKGIESWRWAVHEALANEAAAAQISLPTEAPPLTSHCPYKGLAAYQPEDARFFFGREALVDELVRRIRLNQVLVIGGPSGSGKSSLLRAGLIPALKAGALPGSDTWQVALCTPGRDPIAELYFQVTSQSAQMRSPVSLEDLLAHPTLARHLGGGNGSAHPLVLCIDQFEEMFTLAPAALRSKFVAALSAMTDPADSRVRIVIAVRADFYAECAGLPWLAERITENQVLVGPMTGPELRRAVSEPARPVGLYLERGLVDAIVDEAGNEAGSLPLVAHALVETWIRRQGHTLTLEGFHAAGGVAGAISQTADAMFEERFDDAEREATKRLFLRLVTPGDGTPDTRRLLARSEIDRDSNPDVMHRVVECLTEVRLLTVDEANVQIAHEALLRTWPRLRGWIEESRDELRMRQRISRAAAEWDAEARDSDLLYRGTPLLSALEWAGKNADQLGELEQAFLEASAESRARAQALATEKKRRARRIRRAAVATLTALAVGTTAASVIAFLAFREAQQNEMRAESATVEAHERFAGALGAAANGLVDVDPLLALFLGAEAVARAEGGPPGYDARAAMVAARRVLAEGGPFPVGSPIAAGDALAIALSSDGAVLAAAQRDGGVDLIDTATRRPIGPTLRGHNGGVRDVDFGPDDRWLASAGADGTVRLWRVDDGFAGRGNKIGETDDVISGIRFGPQGSTVASANGDGTVRLWDVTMGIPLGEPLIQLPLGFKVIEFSPDGRGLIAGYNDGTIYGWELPSRELLFEPIQDAHTSNLSHLVISPAGDRFATSSTDGTSVVFEYPTGRIIGPAFDEVDQIGAVVFTSDGGVLIGGDGDGALKLWDVEQQERVSTTPSGHGQSIVDAELSANGRLLATLGRDQLIRLWSLGDTYPLTSVRKVAGRSAKGVAFSDDGRRLAAGDDTGVVQVWELNTDRAPRELLGHEHQVWALAFSPTDALLASGDRAGQVRIWNPADGTLQLAIAAHDDGAVWSLAFTVDGQRLMTASDGSVRLWDVTDGAMLESLKHEGGSITRAVISPDGTFVAAASTNGKVRLWNLEDSTVVRDIKADDNALWSVAFSPDTRHLATASSDEVVAVWDIETGQRRAAFTGQTGGATDVAYLGDGTSLVALDRSGKLHWWDTVTGRRLTEVWQGHLGTSWRLAVHPDGERFVTAGDDGQVKIWDELSVARACEIGSSAFDEIRSRQYLGEDEHSVACEQGQ